MMYKPGGDIGRVSRMILPFCVFSSICRVSRSPLLCIVIWKLLAQISLKLIRFLVARGAKMADLMWITVPFGNVTCAGPWPSSMWLDPDIVVMDLWDGVMYLK